MVKPKGRAGSLPPTGNNRPPRRLSKRPEVDDNVDTSEKKSVPPSEKSMLCSTDQPELGTGGAAEGKVNDANDGKGDAASGGEVVTPVGEDLIPCLPGRLLFINFGSNQTSLIDLAFPDSFEKMHDKGKQVARTNKFLIELFPNKVTIHMPQDEALLSTWKRQLDQDADTLKKKENLNSLQTVLSQIGLEYNELEMLCIKHRNFSVESAEKVVGWALSHHLMQNTEADLDMRLVLSPVSIQYGLELLQAKQNDSKSLTKSLKDVETEDEFEKKLLADVISPSDIGMTFDDIGALENVKDILKELVMLPLQRPERFCKSQLTKPCKGILLFGPPGTGKTMLAKAIATEAGANFINISMSSITSKWSGKGEKCVKAVFSLASRIAPCVILLMKLIVCWDEGKIQKNMRRCAN